MDALASQVLSLIQAQGLEPGSHLPSQALADQLRLSRTPVNQALLQLAQAGYLKREKNRGFFIAAKPLLASHEAARAQHDSESKAYFAIAEDLLQQRLAHTVSETALRKHYRLTHAELMSVLNRISSEGWVEKKPGYGWEFSTMLTTPDSLVQSYRLRLALEPAALLEPGYNLAAQVIEQCRKAEHHLLDGGIESDTPDQLHARGVTFHEALVNASGNAFFIDSLRRVNKLRRLLSYRSMQDRKRYKEHCAQHLHLLDLLEAGKHREASKSMQLHLTRTLENLQKIRPLFNASSS